MSSATINAKDVMKLRQKTGLGMMDCKEALINANGDMEEAEKYLRETQKGKMDKRTDRPAGEGRIAIAIDGPKACIVECRSETDFTARNDMFGEMCNDIARHGATQPAGTLSADAIITEKVDTVRITTNENASFARGEVFEGGSFGQYIHHDHKLGVLIQIDGGTADQETLAGICQHIAAHVPTPVAVDQSGMPADLVAEKKAEAVKEAQESGKPAEIAEKIAEGKMRKFFEENTLLGQKYIKDPEGKKTVKDLLPAGITVTGFRRYVVGQM